MIKINDILRVVNEGLKTHYFKDIKTFGVCELVTKKDQEDNDVTVPAIYTGDGQYQYVLEDTNGLIIYYRIVDFDNDEDLDNGFGRDSLTTENYTIKAIFYGQQIAIEQSCEDINYNLAKEFKKLFPRKVNLADSNRITVGGINYNKQEIKGSEFTPFNPESVLFTIDLNVVIKGIEDCNELSCDIDTFVECLPSIVTDGSDTIELYPSDTYTCTPVEVKSGIRYNREDYNTGQDISYATFDDGWQLAAGAYDFTHPANPETIQELDLITDPTGNTLLHNNKHGNKFRWTLEDGTGVTPASGQSTAAIYECHYSALAVYFQGKATYDNTFGVGGNLETFNSSGTTAYSDWFAPNTSMMNYFTWHKTINLTTNMPAYYQVVGEHMLTSTTSSLVDQFFYKLSYGDSGYFRGTKSGTTPRVFYVRQHS